MSRYQYVHAEIFAQLCRLWLDIVATNHRLNLIFHVELHEGSQCRWKSKREKNIELVFCVGCAY